MASSKKAAKAQSAAQDAWTNPYVQRLVQDEELRDNLKVAYLSARSAYARVHNGKAPAPEPSSQAVAASAYSAAR